MLAGWAAALAALALVVATAGPVHAADEAFALDVPYRSQLDGSAYAAANCGPTSVSMVLHYYGIQVSPWDARVSAMKAQGSWVTDEGGYSHGYGVFIHHLATVAEREGLRTRGLWHREGFRIDRLNQWTAADLRNALRDGLPVIAQVRYRSLPGRAGSPFSGDHYVVVHGVSGDGFVYSDPLDRDGGGPARLIAADALEQAMERATAARAAFAVYRPG
jgi:hypothetical protein